MKLTLKNDKKYVAIEIPQSTSQDLSPILDRIFTFLSGTENPIAPITMNPLITISRTTEKDNAETFSRETAKKIIDEAKQRIQSRPRAMPKVNESEPTLFTNIGEQFGDKLQHVVTSESEPEHWKTGIQHKKFDGEQVPCYRTKYYCPNQHQGKRYIPEGTEFVYCHTCNTKIGVRLAHEDGFPNQDEWGNFFIADQPWEQN